MIGALLSNVPESTAVALSYAMLGLVVVLLVSGPALVYYFWRQNKKMKAASPTGSA